MARFRIVALAAFMVALLVGGATAPVAASVEHCPDGWINKVDGKAGSYVPPSGTVFCIKGGPGNTGKLTADGTHDLDWYVVDSGLLNPGGNPPAVSYYAVYERPPVVVEPGARTGGCTVTAIPKVRASTPGPNGDPWYRAVVSYYDYRLPKCKAPITNLARSGDWVMVAVDHKAGRSYWGIEAGETRKVPSFRKYHLYWYKDTGRTLRVAGEPVSNRTWYEGRTPWNGRATAPTEWTYRTENYPKVTFTWRFVSRGEVVKVRRTLELGCTWRSGWRYVDGSTRMSIRDNKRGRWLVAPFTVAPPGTYAPLYDINRGVTCRLAPNHG